MKEEITQDGKTANGVIGSHAEAAVVGTMKEITRRERQLSRDGVIDNDAL